MSEGPWRLQGLTDLLTSSHQEDSSSLNLLPELQEILASMQNSQLVCDIKLDIHC